MIYLAIACLVFFLLLVIFYMHVELREVRAIGEHEASRADSAAGDAALWRSRSEDEREARRSSDRAYVEMCVVLNDEIERQHELRDEQTDRVAVLLEAVGPIAHKRAGQLLDARAAAVEQAMKIRRTVLLCAASSTEQNGAPDPRRVE